MRQAHPRKRFSLAGERVSGWELLFTAIAAAVVVIGAWLVISFAIVAGT